MGLRASVSRVKITNHFLSPKTTLPPPNPSLEYRTNRNTMKKLFYILFVTIICSIHAKSTTTDTIPNAGFERWVNSIWALGPDLWTVSNFEILPPSVVADSFPYSGFLAMKLINYGNIVPIAWTGFPITNHPINIGGYMKNQLYTNDSVTITVQIYSNQVLVDSGYGIFYGGINPNYIPFIVPVNQSSMSADSCIMYITGCNTPGSEIIFDDLQFDFQVGIKTLEEEGVNFYPNPCKDLLIVEMKNPGDLPLSLSAFDMKGRLYNNAVHFDNTDFENVAIKPGYAKFYINTSLLSKGIWLIELKNQNTKRYLKIVKE